MHGKRSYNMILIKNGLSHIQIDKLWNSKYKALSCAFPFGAAVCVTSACYIIIIFLYDALKAWRNQTQDRIFVID
jgi:hypothetical protein